MALIGSLAFQACSKTEDGSTASGESKEQVITLAVVNGNNSSTRAGRPLLSSEPNHTIENVTVYVVNDSDNTIAATKTYSDWQNESADYRTDDGRFVEFLLDDKLEDGRYRIFAVGYHNGSSYGDITGALVSAGTFNENAALALSEDKGAEEIFAGSTEAFDVVKTEGFKRTIVLNRQVAGVYVYANEIPYIAGGHDTVRCRLRNPDVPDAAGRRTQPGNTALGRGTAGFRECRRETYHRNAAERFGGTHSNIACREHRHGHLFQHSPQPSLHHGRKEPVPELRGGRSGGSKHRRCTCPERKARMADTELHIFQLTASAGNIMNYDKTIFTALFTLLAAACTHDGFDSGDSRRTEMHDTEIEFVLGTTQTGTRSTVYGHTFIPDGALIPQNEPTRIVLSSNNWQQVNDVRIYVFKRNSTSHFTYYRPLNADGVKQDYIRADEFLDKFDISPYAVWWGGTDDMDETHSFTGSMVLESGEYRFLAVARDDCNVPADRRLTDPNVPAGEWLAWTEATTILEEATLACTGRPDVSATELFSGHTGESVTIDGSGSSSSWSSSGQSNPPMPAYWLLRADIPSNTAVRNGSYVNTSPENTEHPDAILKGAFVMPQQANGSMADKGKTYDNSLYLVFIGYDSYLKKEIALEWRPVRLVSDTDSCDPLYYPILANHFYSIGSCLFAEDGSCLADDTPIDLQEEGKVEITVCIDDCWNEFYGGAIGSPCPGLWAIPNGENMTQESYNNKYPEP